MITININGFVAPPYIPNNYHTPPKGLYNYHYVSHTVNWFINIRFNINTLLENQIKSVEINPLYDRHTI
jgi:hypothetical protein